MNILVLDDEKEIADLVEVYLKNENYNVFKFYDSKEAIKCIENQKLDFAILDVMIKDVDGFEICKMIRDKGFNFPVIMLTAKIEDKDKIQGLTLGADDYITKPFSVRELMARVKANLRKAEIAAKAMESGTKEKETEAANTVVVGDLSIDLNKFEVKVRGEIIDLTLREFEVIRYLAAQPGQVVTRETLLEKVWGYEYYGDIRTVDVTVRRIREKIEKDTSTPKILITKRGVGYYIASREVTM